MPNVPTHNRSKQQPLFPIAGEGFNTGHLCCSSCTLRQHEIDVGHERQH